MKRMNLNDIPSETYSKKDTEAVHRYVKRYKDADNLFFLVVVLQVASGYVTRYDFSQFILIPSAILGFILLGFIWNQWIKSKKSLKAIVLKYDNIQKLRITGTGEILNIMASVVVFLFFIFILIISVFRFIY